MCFLVKKKKGGAKFHLPHPHICGETLSSYTEGVLPAFVALSVQIQSEARPSSQGGLWDGLIQSVFVWDSAVALPAGYGQLITWRNVLDERTAVYLRCTWCTLEEAGAEEQILT